MKKQAKELIKGDKINIAGQVCLIEETEISDMGKQGKRKVRIVAISNTGEKVIIIRPEDYAFDSL